MGQRSRLLAGIGAAILCVGVPSASAAQELTAAETQAEPAAAPVSRPAITVIGSPDRQGGVANNRVSVGFHTVAGARRYAVRSEDENGMVNVRFSAIRPYGTDSGGAIPVRLPVSRVRLTSRYGYRIHPISGRGSSHSGIDLAVATGTPVVATAEGEVRTARYQGGYGLLVTVDHPGGVQTRYAHLSSIAVVPGQSVREGEFIGRSGSTGRSTGPHLHYEVRVDGRTVNPLPPS
ncbi:M23 family metallopeptidase [Erythrobacter alti]|uniref:M23 family metallopeptidase n=1 Tax=Erythrobacter alti TaxID=1896145 RepID=UPI0030F4A8A6